MNTVPLVEVPTPGAERLHPDTLALVQAFAAALAEKLADAEDRYGYGTSWRAAGWMDECRAQLVAHVAKGDPRDVAAYCAFLWFHGEPTSIAPRVPEPIAFVIRGEPASKANSREIVTHRFRNTETGQLKVRPMSIKSDKARRYERDALRQIPSVARQRLTGPVRVTLRIFYATERPDLDESIVLDVLQDKWKTVKRADHDERMLLQNGCYRNDRQVREKHIFHGIDPLNPRAEVMIEPLTAQQGVLELLALDPFEEAATP
jgi:Holliday junction resolvase RusA-like endonuclease